MIRYPGLYVSRILKEKYFRNGNLLSCTSKLTDSVVCNSICGVKDIFKLGIVFDKEEELPSWKYSSSGEYTVRIGYEIA